MNKHEIIPLFSNPVFVSKPEGPTQQYHEVLEYCKTLEYNINEGENWASENTDILSDPVFKDIRKLIQDELDVYTKNIMMWNSNEFYITQSWVNANPKNTEHHIHYHLNSVLSGTFYLQTVDNDSISFRTDSKPTFSFERSSFNIWNSDTFKVPVTDNAIVIFPSGLFHSVEKHEGDWERVSIAFNVFFRGELGNRQNLTYLDIK
jgi:uncharacterized protein (TIGR02466 family)